MNIRIFDLTGEFAENKDLAARIRENQILPAAAKRDQIVLDFSEVRFTTQSFIHALISAALQNYGEQALDFLEFKGCNAPVQAIISNVVQYSLDSVGAQ